MMRKIITVLLIACSTCSLYAQSNVIDEVVWVVGDEAILRSDVEALRLNMQIDGQRFDGDPYCTLPEQMAIQKLYLNQAKIDSVDVSEAQILQSVERNMNYMVNQLGSREKLEEYLGKKYSQIKNEQMDMMREQMIVEEMQRKLVGEIKLTPSEVRKYYNQLSVDSLPTIPTTVEAQIITFEPQIPFEETDAIKARLREYTERVNSGEIEFSTLARMYSEDPGSAVRGGELGFTGKGTLAQEFANAAFNLSDPKRISPIVQTEYGYHIIQLIEKRGDRINCRHILLRPKVSEKELSEAIVRMDSLYNDLMADKFSFEEAATYLSSDKDTRNNKGLMVNKRYESDNYGTPRFEMQELHPDIGRIVYNMEVGELSKPFVMKTEEQQKEVVAVVKLKARLEQHKANISDDFQALKAIVENRKREELLDNWIRTKQKEVYVRISDGWQGCDFRYPNWVTE